MRSFPEIFKYDDISNRERRQHLGCEYDNDKRLVLEKRYLELVQAELQRFAQDQRNLINRYLSEHTRLLKQLASDQDNTIQNHILHHLGGVDLGWEFNTAVELKELQKRVASVWGRIQQNILNEMKNSREGHQANMKNITNDHLEQLQDLNLGLASSQWMVIDIPIVSEEPTWSITSTRAARALRRANKVQQSTEKTSNPVTSSPQESTGLQTQGENNLETKMELVVDTNLAGMIIKVKEWRDS